MYFGVIQAPRRFAGKTREGIFLRPGHGSFYFYGESSETCRYCRTTHPQRDVLRPPRICDYLFDKDDKDVQDGGGEEGALVS